MVETLAELPFTGDQVGLFRAQPDRPKRACNPSSLAASEPLFLVDRVKQRLSGSKAAAILYQCGLRDTPAREAVWRAHHVLGYVAKLDLGFVHHGVSRVRLHQLIMPQHF